MSKKIILILMFSLSLFAYDATVEIVKKIDSLPKIAVQDASNPDVSITLRKKFDKILIGDLRVSVHFNPINEYIQSSYDGGVGENFLTQKNVDLILRYKLESEGKTLLVHVKLINASNGEIKNETNYKLQNTNRYPFAAHRIIVDTNDFIGAPSIKWMEQFVIFAKLIGKKESEIVVSDYTLSFQKVVVKGGLNLFPQWANARQDQFYYSSYNGLKPTLYRIDLSNGEREKIISSSGMLVCSDVSRDGRKLLLTMAPNDQADIYLYDVINKNLWQVTKYPGIDVSGKFIDDDDKMVFISDRLGYPNVFSKKLNVNASVEQMVYYGNSNSACSTHGNYIVYKARESSNVFSKNSFNLHLISTQTDFIRRLTATGINEFPEFSKDGDAIIFIKNYKAQSSVGIIRLSHNKNYLFPMKYGRLQSMDW